jgi:molecular chaperone IbpA
VNSADLEDGMLVVRLQNVIPEEKKPRKILIGGDAKYLVEEPTERAAA